MISRPAPNLGPLFDPAPPPRPPRFQAGARALRKLKADEARAQDTPRKGWSFDAFHKDNPQVYDLFKKFAREIRDAGRARYSARTIGERIRWHFQVEVTGAGAVKLNDHLWPRFARMLIEEDAGFEGFFELRERKGGSE